MTQTNPQPNAYVMMTPTPQQMQLSRLEGTDPQVWALTCMQALATFVILLNREAAMALSDQLREQCSGLQVVRDVPPPGSSNGQGAG